MPTAIIAKTVKGKGVSFMENQAGWHGTAPNDEEYASRNGRSWRKQVKHYVRSKERSLPEKATVNALVRAWQRA